MTKEEKYEMVKKLNDETGCGFDSCGYVLNITHWNYERATKIIDLVYMSKEQFLYEFLELQERVGSLEKIVKETLQNDE